MKAATITERTLLIYSGPTSTDRTIEKNGMYMDNMDYFLEHGVSCNDNNSNDASIMLDNNNDNEHATTQERVEVTYVFVLTQQVADYYLGTDGKITKKRSECKNNHGNDFETNSSNNDDEYIKVIVRQDRCYDMESMRIVLENHDMDVRNRYDHLLFVNCGLVGPKFGPGSPKLIPSKHNPSNNNNNNIMIPYHHWSQIYTSRLTSTIRLVGHSINTHFHTYFPHVQSFLYALTPDTADMLLQAGAIYDCGLSQSELAQDPTKRFELIERYEVGMSTTLLRKGFSISTPFINRWGFGTPLVLDSNSTLGTELDDTICDIWYEDGVRNLTRTMNRSLRWWSNKDDEHYTNNKKSMRGNNDRENTFDYHQWDILPWEYYLFFKVSRLVPQDIQDTMHYNNLDLVDVDIVSNDPRRSSSEFWLRKTREFDSMQPLPWWNLLAMCLMCLGFYSKRTQVEMHLRFLRKQMMSKSGRDD